MTNPRVSSVFFCLIFILCGCNSSGDKKEIMADVDNIPITVEEFKEELVFTDRQSPSIKITPEKCEGELNNLIEKKLLIQKAMEMGLAEDEKFVEAIRRFWEQTLLKDLMDKKIKQNEKTLYVTEKEVRNEYERINQGMPVVKVVWTKTPEGARAIKEKLLKGMDLPHEVTLGPLPYTDIKNTPFVAALDMKEGSAQTLTTDNGYAVVYLVRKEKPPYEPFEKSYGKIAPRLLEEKKQLALEEWVAGLKKEAKIKVDEAKFKQVCK